MIKFRDYMDLTEGRYPMWLKVVTGGIVLRIRNLSNQIQTETDPVKQNKLISQQNNLISYIVGMGIGVSSKDNVLINKFKGVVGPVKK